MLSFLMLTETVYAFSSISGFDLLSCVLLVLVYFDTSSNLSMSLNSENPCVFFLFTVINKSFRAGPSLSDVSCDSSSALSPEDSEPFFIRCYSPFFPVFLWYQSCPPSFKAPSSVCSMELFLVIQIASQIIYLEIVCALFCALASIIVVVLTCLFIVILKLLSLFFYPKNLQIPHTTVQLFLTGFLSLTFFSVISSSSSFFLVFVISLGLFCQLSYLPYLLFLFYILHFHVQFSFPSFETVSLFCFSWSAFLLLLAYSSSEFCEFVISLIMFLSMYLQYSVLLLGLLLSDVSSSLNRLASSSFKLSFSPSFSLHSQYFTSSFRLLNCYHFFLLQPQLVSFPLICASVLPFLSPLSSCTLPSLSGLLFTSCLPPILCFSLFSLDTVPSSLFMNLSKSQ